MQKRHGQYLQFAICCKADFCGIFALPLQRPVKPVSVSVTLRLRCGGQIYMPP